VTDSKSATTSVGEAESTNRKSRGTKLFIRDVVLILVVAIVVSVGIKSFLIRSFYIPSGSMENTLQINDRIIVDELVPNVVPIERGDVVVFTDPGGWLPPTPVVQQNAFAAGVDWVLSVVGLSTSDSGNHLVKRVIGLPGDKVACCNAFGQMTVNGNPLDEHEYVKLPQGSKSVSADNFSITVPPNDLWVMGDNRYDSKDSRYNRNTPSKGFVPVNDVVGRAFLISWPANRWTVLSNFPDVFQGVGRPPK
jgi:signal peptidase I